MAKLEDILKARKDRPFDNINKLVTDLAEGILEKNWPKLKGQILLDTEQSIKDAIIKLTEDVKQGDQGPQGLRGEDGLQGPQGIPGKDGKDGIGVQGETGPDGKDGKDGSPDKPEEIADKLNKTKQSVERYVIKGLEAELTAIKRNVKAKGGGGGGGGGGMGTPVHETFNGDGSTVSFTLANNVAANGKAAWVRYQGQMLVDADTYSISGKTLTLSTFTPETGTFIDITYIRA